MAYKRMMDKRGKPIRNKRGEYRYEVQFRLGGRGSKQVKRRIYAANDGGVERFIQIERGKSGTGLTWLEGLPLFIAVDPFVGLWFCICCIFESMVIKRLNRNRRR